MLKELGTTLREVNTQAAELEAFRIKYENPVGGVGAMGGGSVPSSGNTLTVSPGPDTASANELFRALTVNDSAISSATRGNFDAFVKAGIAAGLLERTAEGPVQKFGVVERSAADAAVSLFRVVLDGIAAEGIDRQPLEVKRAVVAMLAGARFRMPGTDASLWSFTTWDQAGTKVAVTVSPDQYFVFTSSVPLVGLRNVNPLTPLSVSCTRPVEDCGVYMAPPVRPVAVSTSVPAMPVGTAVG